MQSVSYKDVASLQMLNCQIHLRKILFIGSDLNTYNYPGCQETQYLFVAIDKLMNLSTVQISYLQRDTVRSDVV